MDNLHDFIKIYPAAINRDVCEYLINFYEMNEEYHERHDNERKPNFTQINLTKRSKEDEELNNIHNSIIQHTFHYRNLYYEFIDKRCFPQNHAFEQYRIKKYNNDGIDGFDTHVDIVDYDTARRFLSFMWYLNDVHVGGQTMFKDLTIEPRCGTLVVFPPLWMFPHNGQPPISHPKYIMTTYLHYQ
jgi:hypothetical protein